MDDLKLATDLMGTYGFSMVVVKNGNVIYQSGEGGIRPFFEALITDKKGLEGASIADKVVGLSLAHLLTYAGVSKVYGELISKPAINFLKQNKIIVNYKIEVPLILNKTKDNLCFFEKMAQDFTSCEDAFKKIRYFLITSNS